MAKEKTVRIARLPVVRRMSKRKMQAEYRKKPTAWLQRRLDAVWKAKNVTMLSAGVTPLAVPFAGLPASGIFLKRTKNLMDEESVIKRELKRRKMAKGKKRKTNKVS